MKNSRFFSIKTTLYIADNLFYKNTTNAHNQNTCLNFLCCTTIYKSLDCGHVMDIIDP